MSDDLPWWQPQVGPAELGLVQEVLASNYLNDGKVTARFEGRLAELLGCKHAVAVTSGTAALFLAVKGFGIGAGDEVLVPDVTFIATANAVTLAGATPVLVDVDARTLNMCPRSAARAITPRTRAIIPVHVSGRPADLDALQALARDNRLVLVEDAAEGLLSHHHGRPLGTIGDAGIISFSPNKTITTGQGGVVLTNDGTLHRRLRELKDQGRAVQGTGGDDMHPVLGFNFKLTNLQAAVGLGQLDLLGARVERLRRIYEGYREGLAGVPGVELPGFDVAAGETPQWVDLLTDARDGLADHLESQRMHCRRFWYPLHTQGPYRRPDAEFPVSSRVVPRALWLPSAFTLSDADVARVCGEVRRFLEGRVPQPKVA